MQLHVLTLVLKSSLQLFSFYVYMKLFLEEKEEKLADKQNDLGLQFYDEMENVYQ